MRRGQGRVMLVPCWYCERCVDGGAVSGSALEAAVGDAPAILSAGYGIRAPQPCVITACCLPALGVRSDGGATCAH